MSTENTTPRESIEGRAAHGWWCWLRAGLVALGVLCSVPRAAAQGCCASGSSLTPIRLDLHERALAGLQVGALVQQGSFADDATYRGLPAEASDVELRQTLFATVAPWSRLQLSALVPWVETRRTAAGASPEWGVGLGDMTVAARFEPLQLRDYPSVPGVALLFNAVTPSGTAPEAAENVLGSDATGAGVWRLGGGLAVERDYDAFLFNLTVLVSQALSRSAESVRFAYAPRWDLVAAVGYAMSHYWHSALVLAYEQEGAPQANGTRGFRRRRSDVTLLLTRLVDDGWRLQGAVTLTPPVDGLGRNEVARWGGSLAVVRSWW